MSTLRIALPADVLVALEAWRGSNLPEGSLADAARVLICSGLANAGAAPDAPVYAARADALREMRVWIHSRLRRFLAEVAEESQRIG